MKYTRLGNTDIDISNLGFGSMVLTPDVYGDTNDEESKKALQRAQDLGVTFFDTADAYGNGQNEELVGKSLQGKREDYVIATKVGFLENFSGVSNDPKYIKQSIDKSLKRLNTDYVDLYYLHNLDPEVPIEESVGAMSELVEAGKIRSIGLSNGTTADILKRAHAVHPISALQLEYNLWTRFADEEGVFPLAKELGATPVSYSPLSRGLLTGKLEKNQTFAENDSRNMMQRYQKDVYEHNIDVVNQLQGLASQKQATVAQLTLAWIIQKGVVPIPGTKNIQHLEENIKASEIQFTEEEMKHLEELSRNYHLKGGGGNSTIYGTV